MKKIFAIAVSLIFLATIAIAGEPRMFSPWKKSGGVWQTADGSGVSVDDLSADHFWADQNVETLSAAKTLAVTDMMVQKLDPNGSDRDVTLPAEASSTDLMFLIINMANGAGEDLVIKNDAPATLGTLLPEMAAICTCDGTTWTVRAILPMDSIQADGVNGNISLTGAFFIEGSSGKTFINESTNANASGPSLTINQASYDDEILALKSSDVAHGYATGTETDTYFYAKKGSAAYGGTILGSYAEDAATGTSLGFYAWGGTADTTHSTAGTGLVQFSVAEHNGSNALATLAADSNVFAINAYVDRGGAAWTTLFIIDEDGDTWQPGIITAVGVYAHDMNGETIRDLQINNSGELGYDSSSIRGKIERGDLAETDTSWIYDLRPVIYEPKKKERQVIAAKSVWVEDSMAGDGKGHWKEVPESLGPEEYTEKGVGWMQYGLIAEEVEQVNPDLVFYDKGAGLLGSDQVAGVHYGKQLIVPMLAELQKQKARIDNLETRIEALENGI